MKTLPGGSYLIPALLLGLTLSLGENQAQTTKQAGAGKKLQLEQAKSEKQDAAKVLAQTLERAAKTDKQVLVHLGAPW